MGHPFPARVALLSDLHANLAALEACLAHARQAGVDGVAVLGDLVGYGPDPEAVVDRVQALQAEGAWVLRGNHDELAVAPPAQVRSVGEQTALWTHERLSPAQRQFLADLPLTGTVADVLIVHASARQPAAWEYVSDGVRAQRCLDAARDGWGLARVCVGHVHEQRLFYGGQGHAMMAFQPTPGVAVPAPRSRPMVCTVGSVGQPRDGDPRAMYAVLDLAAQRMTYHRVPYDHLAVAERVRRVGLPEGLAQRLENAR